MPAIFTDKYRTFLAKQFLTALTAQTVMAYMFIGHPQEWVDAANVAVGDSTPPVPKDIVQNVDFDYWRDMLGAKRIYGANTQYVVARHDWTTGTVYTKYDDLVEFSHEDFYVLDTNIPYKVYKCLWNNGGGASTIAPSTIGTALTPQATSDGYVWQYMYTITAGSYPFLTSEWMPVLSNSSVQTNSLTNAGKLPTAVPLVIVDGGSGYSAVNPITTTIVGDGTGATVGANGVAIVGGLAQSITLATGGLGYTQVSSINVYQSGAAVQASVRAIIPPYPNHGYDPVKELSASAVLFIAKFNSNESGKLTVQNNYRRIGLLVNPTDPTGNVANATFYRQTTDITISANTGVLHPDDVVTNITKTSKPTATVVDVVLVSNNYIVRVTSVNDKGETTPFSAADTIKCLNTTVEATVANTSGPELTPFSGEILYVEQRTPITRSSGNSELIKIALSFQ